MEIILIVNVQYNVGEVLWILESATQMLSIVISLQEIFSSLDWLAKVQMNMNLNWFSTFPVLVLADLKDFEKKPGVKNSEFGKWIPNTIGLKFWLENVSCFFLKATHSAF